MKTANGQRQQTARSIVCLMMLILASGCIAVRDVTKNPEIRGAYARGDVFEVLSDVAVTEFGLLSPLERDINLYRNPHSPKEGIVDAGTVMRVERVVYRRHPENGASLHPMAVIQSGRWQGREVDLRHLSRSVREAGKNPYTFHILEPDSQYLKSVDGPEEAAPGAAVLQHGE